MDFFKLLIIICTLILMGNTWQECKAASDSPRVSDNPVMPLMEKGPVVDAVEQPIMPTADPGQAPDLEEVSSPIMPVLEKTTSVDAVVAPVMPIADEHQTPDSVESPIMPVSSGAPAPDIVETPIMPLESAPDSVELPGDPIMPVADDSMRGTDENSSKGDETSGFEGTESESEPDWIE